MLLSEGLKIKSTNIDLLKFVCAILVIMCHAFAIAEGTSDLVFSWTNNQLNLGGVAVAVFFLLSGLYLSKSLDRDTNLVHFFKNRCKRLFPQLWIVIILTTFLVGPIVTTVSLKEYFLNGQTYLYLCNLFLLPVHSLPGVFESNITSSVNGSLWTLPVEFACYIALIVVQFVIIKIEKSTNKDCKFVIHSICTASLFLIYLYFLMIAQSDFMVSVIRPTICFFVGLLYYDLRERIQLNPIVGIVSLVVLSFLRLAPLFNILIFVLLPYGVLSITLGTKQLKINSSILKASYEMYLVGWLMQQLVVLLFHTNTAILNSVIAIPLDIVFGYLLMKLTDRIMHRVNVRN